ncbi:MAG: hypothetical protein JWP15_2757 [Alphaproteobacteria bacterium]|nr:hypothetical protein [Alphaproteobacteria bacterium]
METRSLGKDPALTGLVSDPATVGAGSNAGAHFVSGDWLLAALPPALPVSCVKLRRRGRI